MIIEMRTYKTKPGLREAFLAIFRAKSMPAHREIGMTIDAGTPDTPDGYIKSEIGKWSQVIKDADIRASE